jgi:murein L,D-transpeptidase YafK
VVVVNVRRHELWLCQDGASVAKFPIAIGRGGVDKHHQGDGRTPLGTYALGSPRPSAQYGMFIPIAYPTPEQAANGFTGGDVGIHGPPRGLTEPAYPTTGVDWTQGCIATGLDEDIGVIAEFVRMRQPVLVVR